MLTKPTQTTTFQGVYPDTTSNRELLGRLVEARKVIDGIEQELRPRAINTKHGYGKLEAGEYPKAVEELTTAYQEAMEKSEPDPGG